MRSSSSARSSSRKARSTHQSAVFVCGAFSGAVIESSATRVAASHESSTWRYTCLFPGVPGAGSIVSSFTPCAPRTGTESASSRAHFVTVSFQRESGAMPSTRFHSTARLPLMPSATVEKTSQRSRRILRLSVMRVRPPVPGKTPSSGTSGKLTALLRSSTSRILSQARASS